MTDDDAVRRRTFAAIEHAAKHIQAMLSRRITSKFSPRLSFHEDTKMRNTLETLRIIDEAAKEFKEKDSQELDDSDLQ
jgi:ribosome-binding factor A